MRTATVLARRLGEVALVPWTGISVSDGVSASGPCWIADSSGVRAGEAPRTIESLLHFAPECCGPTDPRGTAASDLLLRASRAGACTNLSSSDGQLGRKDVLELMLARAERRGESVPRRPETIVAARSQVPAVVSRFAERGRAAIVKPACGARGEGIFIDPAEPVTADDDYVVQELLADPLLADGRKVDVRTYLAVEAMTGARRYHGGPNFVRRAVEPHEAGCAEAEITNTAHRCRLGLAPDIHPLEEFPFAGDARAVIDELVASLASAHASWAAVADAHCRVPLATPRVLLWGLDIALTVSDGALAAHLLEINPQPVFFCGTAECERLMEDWLADAYLSLVMGQ